MAIQLYKIWDNNTWKNIVKPYYWNGSSWVACKKISTWEDGFWATVWQPDPFIETRRPTTSALFSGSFTTITEDFSGNGNFYYYNIAANLNKSGQSAVYGFPAASAQTFISLTLKADGLGSNVFNGSSIPSTVSISLSLDGGSTYPTTLYSASASGVAVNLLSSGYALSTSQDLTLVRVRTAASAGRIGGEAEIFFNNLRTEGSYYP